MREDARTKGMRYITEARLVIDQVSPGIVHGRCRGDGAVYRCGWARAGWYCSCPARGRCAHLHALGLVVAPNNEGEDQ